MSKETLWILVARDLPTCYHPRMSNNRRPPVTITCANCSNQFSRAYWRYAKKGGADSKHFCSSECWNTYCRDRHRTAICSHCSKEFNVDRPRKDDQLNFCSRECGYAYQRAHSTQITKVCVVCGSEFKCFKSADSRFSTCSKKCLRINRTGENNYSWKGGTSKRPEWGSVEYKQWRKSVFERDDYTCQAEGCGQRGGALEAHHIIRWIDSVDLRYDISNGQTLCRDCHNLTKRKSTI